MGIFTKTKAENEEKSDRKIPIKSLLDGSILTREGVIDQLPYLLFLTLIAVFYIGNRYHAEKIVREMQQTQAELRELRAESITSASKLMFISKQSEVAKMVQEKGLDLKEAVEPPKKLVVK